MLQNPQFPADLVTFIEEILNGKLHILWNKFLKWNLEINIIYTLLKKMSLLENFIFCAVILTWNAPKSFNGFYRQQSVLRIIQNVYYLKYLPLPL